MKAWIVNWFTRAWRDRLRRLRVGGEYADLAKSKDMLADLCMRNFVFAKVEPPPGVAPNLYDIGIAEGRRRCVLEILDLVRVDPRELAELEVQPAARGEAR